MVTVRGAFTEGPNGELCFSARPDVEGKGRFVLPNPKGKVGKLEREERPERGSPK